MAEITKVTAGSKAEAAGILKGDFLLEINKHPIRDVLDYQFYMTECLLDIRVHRGPEILSFHVEKEEYEDLGLEFPTYLMDEKQCCRNKCVFCFIDQLPKGMRDTLYFKDDDSRLSFLQGNYVTLTNMKDEELYRIVKMHITPVNISVHTTNGALRVEMMKNRFASRILEQMKILADGGVLMNCQIVLCKGYNDGEELTRTMKDLKSFYPAVSGVSIVPSGLTKHRENLTKLEPFTKEDCSKAIHQINAFGDCCKKELGKRIFYASDEFYIKAGLPIPEEEYYEGYPQIENGVGMMRSMDTEIEEELSLLSENFDLEKEREVSIATGVAAYDFICEQASKIERIAKNTKIHVYKIVNRFFGESVTVTGLICGCDLLEQLKNQKLGEKLLIPEVMLRSERDLFLDGTSVREVEEKLQVRVEITGTDGFSFVSGIMD